MRVELGVDMSDDNSLHMLAEKLGATRIDWLVCNAGMMVRDDLGSLDREAMVAQFEVNALGPLFLASALAKQLGKGSKIGIVTSRMGSIADNGSGGFYGYRLSKVAVNMAGMSLARDLAPRGISVVLLHPGFINTEMTGGQGNDTPDVAARGIADRMGELTPETSGSFRHANGETLPW